MTAGRLPVSWPVLKLARALLPLGLSLLGVLALACTESGQAGPRRGGPAVVEVAMAKSRDVPIRLDAIGAAESVHTVSVISQVTGSIEGVHFKEGDAVKKGDLLFTMDTRLYGTNLAVSRAELAKSEALAKQARTEARRAAALNAEGLASAQYLAQSQAAAAAADATLASGRAQMQSASLDVQFTRILAPIDGRTGAVLVQAGNVVKANDNVPLVVIRSLTPIYVRFAVPEEYLTEIRRRMRDGVVVTTARPRGSTAAPVKGELTFIENTVDPATGTVTMKAEFTNGGEELWPGQFVEVSLLLGVDHDVVVAPEQAVQVGQEGTTLFVVGADDKAHLRKVVVKRTVDGEAVIKSGLAAGERVVIDGQVKLRDGSPVTLARNPGASAAHSSAPSKAARPGASAAHSSAPRKAARPGASAAHSSAPSKAARPGASATR